MYKDLTKANDARLQNALEKKYLYNNKEMTLQEVIESKGLPVTLSSCNGMIDYNRRTFNRMTDREQREYMKRLEAKTYYFVNDIRVPKMVFDFYSAN